MNDVWEGLRLAAFIMVINVAFAVTIAVALDDIAAIRRRRNRGQ